MYSLFLSSIVLPNGSESAPDCAECIFLEPCRHLQENSTPGQFRGARREWGAEWTRLSACMACAVPSCSSAKKPPIALKCAQHPRPPFEKESFARRAHRITPLLTSSFATILAPRTSCSKFESRKKAAVAPSLVRKKDCLSLVDGSFETTMTQKGGYGWVPGQVGERRTLDLQYSDPLSRQNLQSALPCVF